MQQLQLSFDFDGDNFVSLTSMYAKAVDAGKADGKRNPSDWAREAGATFIKKVAQKLNTQKTGIYKTTRGKNGGTWAHWQIGAAYATYLDDELHMQFNAAVRAMSLGDPNVVDILLRNATEADQRRMMSKISRRNFTDRLKAAGVTEGVVYAMATNIITEGVIGAKVAPALIQRGLTANDNLRDHLTLTELARVTLAESMAADQIEGGAPPMVACERAAKSVARTRT